MKSFFGKVFGAIKSHKIISIIVLSVVVLATGGFIAFKVIMNNAATPPELEAPPATFEYETIASLKEIFAVSEEEKARSIDSYSEAESFSVYKRSFYNFITSDKYRVVTTGQTNVDTMGGITVNINNERKFDGTNFFMHLKSSAAVEGVFANMSNNDAMHYVYVTDDNSNNLATIKILDVNNPSVVKRKDVLTEKEYVYNYGAIPYTACNFIIRENTIKSSNFSFDGETGLYKLEMQLDPVESTKGLIKQMHAVSGTDASYENGSVTYIAYVDNSFTLRRADIKETYLVSTMGLKFNGVSDTSDAFYYEGDGGFIPLAEDEKYDLTDVPTPKDKTDDTTKEISKNAIAKVKSEGVNADFALSFDDVALNGRLQVIFGDVITIKIDTEYKNTPFSLYLSLDQAKAGMILAEINGTKAGLEFAHVGDMITSILTKFGIDLSDVPINAIINSIDIAGLIDSFGNITGTEVESGVYEFYPNLKNTGIPLDLPFKMLVENGSISLFKISDSSAFGKDIAFSLTPSSKEKDLSALNGEETFTDLSGIIDYVLDNVDFDKVLDIVNGKIVKFNISATINGFDIIGSATVDFTELTAPVVKAELNIDGLSLSVLFSDGCIFLKSKDVAVSCSVEDISDYVSIFTDASLDLSSVVDSLKEDIFEIIGSAIYENDVLSLAYQDYQVNLSEGKISLALSDSISLELSGIAKGETIIADNYDYVNLTGLKPLLEKINDQLSTRYFTANGSITIGDTDIVFENVKIVNEGNLKDPTEAFDNGDLTLSGTLYITSGSTTHKLFIQYINSYLFVTYNNSMKIKLSRSSLDYIVDLLKTNYKAIIDRFNYSEIISADDTLTKIKDYEFTIGSIINLLQGISVENGEISLTVNANDFGFTDSAILKAFLNEGNLALDIEIGDKSGNITLDNTPFNKPTAPSSGFIDLSGINGLAKAAVNAILKPSEEYYLSGTINVNIIGIINVDMDMDASVRLVSDGNGGKKIEAVAHISCPRKILLDTAIVRSYFKFGKGTIIYKNEKFYITRTNDSYTDKTTTRRSMSRNYFMDHAVEQICFLLGLTDKVVNQFAASNNEIKVEKLIKNYSHTSGVHTFTIDGGELTGSSAIGDITAKITTQSEQLTKLNVNLGVSSFIDMTLTLNHNINQAGNYSDITNLNSSSYTYLG